MIPARQQALKALVSKNERPFFVLFPQMVKDNARHFMDAAKKRFKKSHIYYSVKTNPHARVLEVLDSSGIGMELVSLRELRAVKSFSGKKIFNAPAATEAELREALAQKCLIIIDNLSQAQLLHSILKGKPLDVGIRVRMDAHRFGFAPQEIKAAIREMESWGLRMVALHAHPGTNQTLQDYHNFLNRVHGLLVDFPPIRILDLGGGFPGNENLRMRKTGIPAYMELVHETLGEFLPQVELVFEVGRSLVEDAMCLVLEVQHAKVVDNAHYALMDSGINVLSKLSMSPLRFIPLQESGEKKHNFFLCGPSMFGSDEFARIFAKLARGDIVVVENVGAYCTELAWNLSRDVPSVLVVEK
ncbi:MAG: alanine racemase [Candidatus Iainarchaeum archaeon]|uniref:Alanine racemase n=1 Tax=Candidatus Iainarchaeum sp. TaxID=3101447 RepID=A0A7T9DJQ9_9ARCH|nr:MAG: alanine racemase [Candidatus Diapherotrites archaeon]